MMKDFYNGKRCVVTKALSIPCGYILLSIFAQSFWFPHGLHQDSTYSLLPFDQVQSPHSIHSICTPCGLHEDFMRSGVEDTGEG
jgi:hypothetical protein